MRQVILDTDVASMLLKQRLPVELLRQIVGAQAGITFVNTKDFRDFAEHEGLVLLGT